MLRFPVSAHSSILAKTCVYARLHDLAFTLLLYFNMIFAWGSKACQQSWSRHSEIYCWKTETFQLCVYCQLLCQSPSPCGPHLFPYYCQSDILSLGRCWGLGDGISVTPVRGVNVHHSNPPQKSLKCYLACDVQLSQRQHWFCPPPVPAGPTLCKRREFMTVYDASSNALAPPLLCPSACPR